MACVVRRGGGLARWARSFAVGTSHTSPVPETMSYLRNLRNGDEVYLIGTAHISRKSADEVRSVIRSVRPDTVFLELCDTRAAAMRRSMSGESDDGGLPEPLRQLLGALGAPGDIGEKMLGAGLKTVYNMFRMSGMDPGKEFKVGIEESDRIGATLVLGDRSQELTIKALRDALSLPDILRMITGGGSMQWDGVDPRLVERFKRVDWNDPESAVELLKTREAVRALTGQMRREFPKVASAMLDQRDDLMTDNLLNKCKGRTVAVVGMAHMDGIESRWRDAMGGDGGVTLIS